MDAYHYGGEFEVLERHLKNIERTAQFHGHELQAVYKEVKSGETIDARPVFRSLLHDEIAYKQWDGVYVVEASRLGRPSGSDIDKIIRAFSFTDTWLITERKIYDPQSDYDMKQLRRELQSAYEERDASVDRLKRGKHGAVVEGTYQGQQPSYGWRRERVNREWALVPHEVNHPRMLMIYDLIFERVPLNEIARRFEDMGFKTPKGLSHWEAATIRGIARNPNNMGYYSYYKTVAKQTLDPGTLTVRTTSVKNERVMYIDETYNGEEIPEGTCVYVKGNNHGNGTISEERWHEAQRIMASNVPAWYDPAAPLKNPLATIFVCGKCGHAMKRHVIRSNNVPRFEHTQKGPRENQCTCKGAKISEVMEILINSLKAIAADKKITLTDKGRAREVNAAR